MITVASLCCVGLFAAEYDKGEGLRMLISRAGGTVAKALTQLDSSGASQVRAQLSRSYMTDMTHRLPAYVRCQ